MNPTQLLGLMQLSSPALPVGGFSYSEGLEAAVDHGWVHDEASASAWLQDQLHLALLRSELPIVARAMPAWQALDTERLQALNDWLLQTRESLEMRLQTEQMGRSLVHWLHNHPETSPDALAWADSHAPTWPVAMALALQTLGVTVREGLLACAFGWAENMVQAAIKAIPLGQQSGQRVLAALTGAIPDAVEQAIGLPDNAMQAFSPGLAILSARHETQYSRLFRS